MHPAVLEKLKRWAAWFDGRTVRERALIALTLLIGLYLVLSQLLWRPLLAHHAERQTALQAGEAQLLALRTRVSELEQASLRDVDALNRARLAELQARLEHRGAELEALTHELVPPQAMANVVEDLLTRRAALDVLGFQNLPPIAISDEEQEGNDNTPAGGRGLLFKHGLRLRLRGRYFDLSRYLADLEHLPWKFLWKHVELHTEQYPSAILVLEIYTLSLDQTLIRL